MPPELPEDGRSIWLKHEPTLTEGGSMPLFSKTEEAESVAPYNGQRWEYKTLNLNFKASVAFEGEFNKVPADAVRERRHPHVRLLRG